MQAPVPEDREHAPGGSAPARLASHRPARPADGRAAGGLGGDRLPLVIALVVVVAGCASCGRHPSGTTTTTATRRTTRTSAGGTGRSRPPRTTTTKPGRGSAGATTTTSEPPASGSPLPVLGRPAVFFQGSGWGEVRPSAVSNGGDPTGSVTRIVWSSWGGPRAVGTGLSTYVGPHQSVAQATVQRVRIVAFGLGVCDGESMYQDVEWYFPQHGQHFDPSVYENVCTGALVGRP